MAERRIWKKRVDQWKRSGLTSAEFASRNGGCNPNTLKFWKWQLGREAREKRAPSKVEFLEVPPPTVLPRSDSALVVELDQRPYRIRLTADFSEDGLRRVLSVLEGAR